MAKGALILGIGVVAVQLIDVAIHVATGQPETIRILSNVIIASWAIWSLSERSKIPNAGVVALVAYLGLNLAFLAMNGLTNPAQANAPRVTLFILMVLTTVLSIWSMRRPDTR